MQEYISTDNARIDGWLESQMHEDREINKQTDIQIDVLLDRQINEQIDR